jgi:hypothetical protein
VVDSPSNPEITKVFATEAEAKKYLADNGPVKVPVFRIPDAMRQTVSRRGMPLFASGVPFKFTPVDHDPFEGDKQ